MKKSLWAVAALMVGLLMVISCGGGDDDGGGGANPTATGASASGGGQPTPTVEDLTDVVAGRFVFRLSDLEGDWRVISSEEVPVEDARGGESSWFIQFSRTTGAGIVETLDSRTTIYNSTERVAEAFNSAEQTVLSNFLAQQAYTSLPLGFQAFYTFLPSPVNKHSVWVRRKTVMFSVELSVADLGGKVQVIALAKDLDDRIASDPEFTP